MSPPPVETEVTPPQVGAGGDDELRGTRLSVSLLEVDDVHYDAAVQFFGDDAMDPARFAEALLGCALALASLRGTDYAWAAMRRFTAYGSTETST